MTGENTQNTRSWGELSWLAGKTAGARPPRGRRKHWPGARPRTRLYAGIKSWGACRATPTPGCSTLGVAPSHAGCGEKAGTRSPRGRRVSTERPPEKNRRWVHRHLGVGGSTVRAPTPKNLDPPLEAGPRICCRSLERARRAADTPNCAGAHTLWTRPGILHAGWPRTARRLAQDGTQTGPEWIEMKVYRSGALPRWKVGLRQWESQDAQWCRRP